MIRSDGAVNLSENRNEELPVTDTSNCDKDTVRYLNYKKTCKYKKDTLKCTSCSLTFHRTADYRKHVQMHSSIKKYKCDKCFESYNAEDNLKLHMVIHQQGPPKCPLCDRNFQRLASLKSHLIVHQVEDVFSCKDCLYEFDKEAQ